MMRLPARRISACKSPLAFVGPSPPKELEQTISASRPVAWAGVIFFGRISKRRTGTPSRARVQAASLPARPPPTTVTRSIL